MKKISIFSLCLVVLVACGPGLPQDMPIGERIGPPEGAVDFCKRHVDDEKCLPAPVVYRIQP